ncbi:MAG: hypothetical protein ACFFHD_09375 [Promethearchaeota archaeon]
MMCLPISHFMINHNNDYNHNTESHVIYPQAINRTGKLFSNLTVFSKDCYIYNDQPSLNKQPTIFIPNYNISYAQLYFENISAINYTKDIETEPTEFIISYSQIEPIYIYQKFAVETDQYINNVSVFIQDIIDEDEYTDENSWEVSIVNCSNDPLGTPNSNDKLGMLKKPHPNDIVAHWEVFDFKNSELGPIFLNTSNTNWTIEDGIKKYWFAMKIKIPPNDGQTGGGPKFLYLNPDGTDPNDIGKGETFAQSPQFINITYSTDDVVQADILNGTLINGDIDSFKYIDNNRFFVNSSPIGMQQWIIFKVKLDIDNLTNSEYTWDDLKDIRKNHLLDWKSILNSIIYSIDFSLVINVSDINLIQDAAALWINPDTGAVDSLAPFGVDILQEDEELKTFKAIEPIEKLEVIQHMNTSINGNNSITFAFYYRGNMGPNMGVYNISINLLNVEIGEIKTIKKIQKYDPIVHDLHYSNNITLFNSTFITSKDEIINSIEKNDNNFLEVLGDSDSNTTIIDFKFNVLTNLDNSIWDVNNPFDWIFNLPNPTIYQIDFRISSNVSIQDPSNLTYATLEIYNGGDFPIFTGRDWFQFSDNKTFADINENTKILKFDSYYTWIIMHLINESDDNSLRARLRFVGNGTFKGINVSIDEFTLNFHVQNAFSSDITSKIGFGINNNLLQPSDIYMENFDTPIADNGTNKGFWEGEIDNAVILQGFFEFNISSLWYAIRFDVRIVCEIFKIKPFLQFIEGPAPQYKTGAKIFSVKVIEPGGKFLEGYEIIFEILNANNITIFDTKDVSNEEGIATASLDFKNTGRKFSIRVRFTEQGLYANQEIYSDYIRIVDDYIIFMDNFLKVLPYIIIGLAAVISFFTVRYYKHARLRRIWAEEAIILDDLIKTSYIMIIHKDVGVSIYDRQISLEGIDSDLISGFLHAISQFRYELKKEKEDDVKGKGFEMDYYDFKIVITDGDFVRVALILDGVPSDKLKENQWLFTEHFEQRYQEFLKDFTGDITPFKQADDLIEKYFNIALIYPLQLAKDYELIKVKGLEKALIGVAEQIQKEKKFFFVSNLLNFAIAGRKESRNEIIYTILELKSKELLIPAKLE